MRLIKKKSQTKYMFTKGSLFAENSFQGDWKPYVCFGALPSVTEVYAVERLPGTSATPCFRGCQQLSPRPRSLAFLHQLSGTSLVHSKPLRNACWVKNKTRLCDLPSDTKVTPRFKFFAELA